MNYSDRKENPVAAAARQPPRFFPTVIFRIRRLLVFYWRAKLLQFTLRVVELLLRDAVVVAIAFK